jgi:hypothetical protein
MCINSKSSLITIESIICELGIRIIKRKGEIIFKDNHFCINDKLIILETVNNIISL